MGWMWWMPSPPPKLVAMTSRSQKLKWRRLLSKGEARFVHKKERDFPFIICQFSFCHSLINLEAQLLHDGSLFRIGTAKRLRLKAQDRGPRAGSPRGVVALLQPWVAGMSFLTRNGLWRPGTAALRLSRPFIFKPRVAEAATLGCRTQPL